MEGSLKAQSIHYKVNPHHDSSVTVCEAHERISADSAFYTGVMRFLQTEWHRHERERNAWQIERAEMKSRIGKLEGDGRTNKRLRESMDKHIRLLEHAIKKEREKAKSLQSGSQAEDKKEESQVTKPNIRPTSKGRCISTFSQYWWLRKTPISRQTPQLLSRPRTRRSNLSKSQT